MTKVLSALRKAQDDPENTRNEVVFSGRQMADFGLVTRSFVEVSGLKDEFFRNTGFDRDYSLACGGGEGCNPVGKFFWDSSTQEFARRIVKVLF